MVTILCFSVPTTVFLLLAKSAPGPFHVLTEWAHALLFLAIIADVGVVLRMVISWLWGV